MAAAGRRHVGPARVRSRQLVGARDERDGEGGDVVEGQAWLAGSRRLSHGQLEGRRAVGFQRRLDREDRTKVPA